MTTKTFNGNSNNGPQSNNDTNSQPIVHQYDNQIPLTYSIPSNQLPTGRRWRTATIGIWNVRGMNALNKKKALQNIISEIKADVAMFNETRLTEACMFDNYFSN